MSKNISHEYIEPYPLRNGTYTRTKDTSSPEVCLLKDRTSDNQENLVSLPDLTAESLTREALQAAGTYNHPSPSHLKESQGQYLICPNLFAPALEEQTRNSNLEDHDLRPTEQAGTKPPEVLRASDPRSSQADVSDPATPQDGGPHL